MRSPIVGESGCGGFSHEEPFVTAIPFGLVAANVHSVTVELSCHSLRRHLFCH